jgi:hypothetical protein
VVQWKFRDKKTTLIADKLQELKDCKKRRD